MCNRRLFTDPKNSFCLANVSLLNRKRERKRGVKETRHHLGVNPNLSSSQLLSPPFLNVFCDVGDANPWPTHPPHSQSQMRSRARVSCVAGLRCRMDYHTAMAAARRRTLKNNEMRQWSLSWRVGEWRLGGEFLRRLVEQHHWTYGLAPQEISG
jgi:hypothetical protein